MKRGLVLAAAGMVFAAAVAGADPPGTIATVAELAHPRGLALTADGGVLVAEPFAADVRKVAADGSVTIVAGTGAPGFGGDGGPALAAQLDQPHGVAVLADGGFVIADALNNRIRRVLPDGTIVTAVGTGEHGFSGDGGPAADAEIAAPRGVATLSDGTLLIADSDNNRIRRVLPDGTITTVAGNGVAGFTGDGGPATDAELDEPFAVAPLPDGGFLIADTGASRIRLVSPDGIISTVAGNGIAGFSGDGGPAAAAELHDPHAVVPLPSGFLIADTFNDRVRRVWPDGTITTVAGTGAGGFSGDGGPAVAAQLDQPKALAVEPDGRILVADAANDRLRIFSLPPLAPPRIVTFIVARTRPALDLRFRVCDGSRDQLSAELRLGSGTHASVTTTALVSTRGGCRPFRLVLKVRRLPWSLRLRVRDDQGLWSTIAGLPKA